MKPVSSHIKDWLTDSSGGYTFGTDLFIGGFSEGSQANAVSIFDTGGFDPDLGYSVYEKPTAMIHIRNDTYLTGYAAAEAIAAILTSKFNATQADTTRYIGVWRMGDTAWLQTDGKGRDIFTMNFTFHRTI